MQAWLFACCCSWQLRLSTRECNPGCGYPLLLRLSGYPLLLRLSGYPQGNLGIHACWWLQPIRTPPPIPGLSPNGRSSSYLQLEFRRRVVRPPGQRPTPFLHQEPCSSLGCRGVIHSKSTAVTPFQKLSLIRQSLAGGATLKRKPNCGCQLLVKRKPHCRHQLSRRNISGLSLTTSSQKGLKNATSSNVARAEVSWCAREPGESLRYTGAPVAGWQQQPRRHQHRYIHRRALLLLLLPQCSTTDASEEARARQLARKKLKLPAKAGGSSTCAERHWISLHRAAFSFG